MGIGVRITNWWHWHGTLHVQVALDHAAFVERERERERESECVCVCVCVCVGGGVGYHAERCKWAALPNCRTTRRSYPCHACLQSRVNVRACARARACGAPTRLDSVNLQNFERGTAASTYFLAPEALREPRRPMKIVQCAHRTGVLRVQGTRQYWH